MSVDSIGNYSNYYTAPATNYRANKYTTLPQPSSSNTNYSNLAPLDKDTVNISASDNIKDTKKKSGMSTLTKVSLGIAGIGAVVGGILLHRHLTSPAKHLSSIFRREISSDEANKMMARYKEIYNIKDKEEYIKQAFNQLKKDYGWEDIPMGYKIVKGSKIEGETANVVGGFRPFDVNFKDLSDGNCEIIDFNVNNIMEICTGESKEEIFSTIVHEFQHCKQHELIYRIDKNKFTQALIKARLNPEMKDEITLLKTAIDKYYAPTWDKLPKLQKGSKTYEEALRYCDDLEHYVGASENTNKYNAQLVERHARDAGNRAKAVLKRSIKN